MAEICFCNGGIINSGLPSKTDTIKKIVKLIFVNKVANDGTFNKIASGDIVNESYITAKINNADASKRWYPSDNIYSVAEERATAITETIDNFTRKVEKGVRTFTGQFADNGAVNTYLKFLNSLECSSVGYFAIDDCGKIIGEEKGGDLYPVWIQDKTLDSRPIPATATTSAKNEITFTVDSLVKDSNIAYIDNDTIGYDVRLINGLLDVVLFNTVTAIDQLEVTADLVYGAFGKKLAFTAGENVSDWTLYNTTTTSNVVFTLARVGNTYTFDFTAQTTGDILTLSVTKTSYESNTLTITMP